MGAADFSAVELPNPKAGMMIAYLFIVLLELPREVSNDPWYVCP
jgi:hypothetical protein